MFVDVYWSLLLPEILERNGPGYYEYIYIYIYIVDDMMIASSADVDCEIISEDIEMADVNANRGCCDGRAGYRR